VGVYDGLYVYRGGRLWYTASLASAPLSIALSANGSIAVVGTRDGHVLVFWNGEEAAQWNAGAPVTSLAASYTGTAIAYEAAASRIGWVDLAPLRITLRGPPQCSEVPITISAGGANYTYAAANGSTLLAPVGPVTIYPSPVAYGDYRCAPLQPNYTAVVPGTAALEYGIQYRISKSEMVSGPDWAYGPATFYAPPVLPAQVIGTSPVNATYVLAEWLVNNTPMFPTPSLTLYIDGPTTVQALYKAVAPDVIPVGQGVEQRLVSISPSGLVAAPVPVSAIYETYYLVETAPPGAVNGTTQLWAPEGSTVEFTAPAVIDLGNGTRLVFKGWSNGQTGNFTTVVTGPMSVKPIYAKEYLVDVSALNNETEIWAEPNSTVYISAPPMVTNGTVRYVFEGWSINGVTINLTSTTLVVEVTGPITAVAQYVREYLVEFYSEYGQPQPASAWAAEGQPVYATVSPELVWKYAFYRFAGWEGPDGQLYQPPVPAMPGRFTAVWAIDIPRTAALYGSIAAVIGLALYIKRRR
jgi:hypothetical protein